MTERELSELEDAAKTGCLTTKEQTRVVKALRQAIAEKADYYADLVQVREILKEKTGERR